MSDKEKVTTNDASSSDPKKANLKSGAKKGNIFQRIGKFFKEYRSELKKISWPTFPEVVKNTVITIIAVLIIGVVIWVFDWGISTLRDIFIRYEVPAASQSDVTGSDAPSVSDLAAVTGSDSDVSDSDGE